MEEVQQDFKVTKMGSDGRSGVRDVDQRNGSQSLGVSGRSATGFVNKERSYTEGPNGGGGTTGVPG